ncbi:MAG: leucine-rich repeat domain-containing protein [Eubacteriales bacterium]|nr:leucine-rich repeat domain-containing protein [Eubacteriales bacterium]MDY3333168.1 leucine-rich repeat domain-containing protein [Gallibacter sp.]
MIQKRIMAVFLAFILALSTWSSITVHANTETDATNTDAGNAVVEQADGTSLKREVSNPSEWTSADFEYSYDEELLSGCDYTREIWYKGSVIKGFSETGLEKVKTNKNLVIPARDKDGNLIMGIGEYAFKEKGLTSVTFPKGMIVPYEDKITNKVTKRGNFIIFDCAFQGNELTNVDLPEGVVCIKPNAFYKNKITTVRLPRTIWHIETQAFASNNIKDVYFPQTCDFQLEMHGMPFVYNQIKSVRLPDYTEVVNKHSFSQNPGMEPVPSNAPDKEKKLGGVVYMYTDNFALKDKERIHHIERVAENQKSWHQKLIVNGVDGNMDASDTRYWSEGDFIIDGGIVKGLSASGIAKRKINKNLVIPSITKTGTVITGLADSTNSSGGLFATADEKFDSVELPSELQIIGKNAFAEAGLKEIVFSHVLKDIGMAAFRGNNLETVILPDTLDKLGGGAFATNPTLSLIVLPKSLKEIPDGAFGCSTGKEYMSNLTTLVIPESVTKIGNNAFAGHNLKNIEIPKNVVSIGNYAFSTKNKLYVKASLTLPEGLEEIGDNAFRNVIVESVDLPKTVKALKQNTFRVEYSPSDPNAPTDYFKTKVFVTNKSQYEDKTNFPLSDYHMIIPNLDNEWFAEDFTYKTVVPNGEVENDKLIEEFKLYLPSEGTAATNKIIDTEYVLVTGFSEQGLLKLKKNKNLVIPEKNVDGKKINGIAASAFKAKELESVVLPSNVFKTKEEDTKNSFWYTDWNTALEKRGDFFIGSNAFSGNSIKTLVLPEGVVHIGFSAFNNNQLTEVTIPKTVMNISGQGFANNKITKVKFSENTDFASAIDLGAFGVNNLKTVTLPNNLFKLNANAFMKNPGVNNDINETKLGGVVEIYDKDKLVNKDSSMFCHTESTAATKSLVQKLASGEQPIADVPWGLKHFTFDETGTIITGLTDAGKEKIKVDTNLVLPNVGPKGVDVVAIGDGVGQVGTFGYKESQEVTYKPTTVVLPYKLEKIGKFAFSTNPIANIVLPETLKEIGMSTFQSTDLVDVVIPNSVTTIGSGAFANSSKLENVILSTGITEIAPSMFSMTAIKSIVIPEGVIKIGDRAFAGTKITDIKWSSTVNEIGKNAFENHQFKEIILPANVTKIGNNAFYIRQEGLPRTLNKLVLNDKLEEIGSCAFGGSQALSMDLPNSVVKLNKDAFKDSEAVAILKTSNASKLEAATGYVPKGTKHEIIFDKLANTGWSNEDFIYDGTTIIGWSDTGKVKAQTNKHLVLPDINPEGKEITAIGESAFKVPDDLVVEQKTNVSSPTGLLTVDLPANLKTIGVKAFEYNRLVNIDLKNVDVISGQAFHGNLLEKIDLTNVPNLGSGAFAMNDLRDIKFSPNTKVIPQAAFSMNIRMSELNLPQGLEQIGESAFAGARLESLQIPDTVKKIDRAAFKLHHIESLEIPGCVEIIGDSAFEGTFKALTLKNLKLNEGIKSIGKNAFKESLLETVNLPNSLETLGSTPFLNNAGANVNGKNVVELKTLNPDKHLKFNEAKCAGNPATHKVIDMTANPNTPVNPNKPNNPDTPSQQGKIYIVIKGNNAKWIKGVKSDLEFRFTLVENDSATFKNFVGIQIDGNDVSKNNYTYREGSVIIDLKVSYLETLSDGEHTIVALFNDGGKASAKFTIGDKKLLVKNIAKTADDFNLIIYIVVAMLALAGFGVLKKTRKTGR